MAPHFSDSEPIIITYILKLEEVVAGGVLFSILEIIDWVPSIRKRNIALYSICI